MSKVWVVNYSAHPYEDAERFGELDFLTKGYVSLGNLQRIVFTVVQAVRETDPDDYLLLSGLLILNAVAASAWIVRHDRVKLLIWDKFGQYEPLEFSREQIERLFDVLTINEAEDKWKRDEPAGSCSSE